METYTFLILAAVNHKFEPTTVYGAIDSARFGIISMLKTSLAIKKDAEVFVDYGYPVHKGLKWYDEQGILQTFIL